MKRTSLALSALVVLGAGCADSVPPTRAVYLLLDTSGTYREEVTKAQSIANYLLGTLVSGDSLALARIDSGSFSEKDIVAKVTFDERPSHANQQKRAFKGQLDRFVVSAGTAQHTDITGAVMQAAEWLNETGAGHKYILVFSDLEEDVQKGFVRDFPIDVTGIQVVALNVTKLRSDQVDPREYMDRLAAWEKRVVSGGGTFRMINDLERLDGMLGS
jgi:hypothetical protein